MPFYSNIVPFGKAGLAQKFVLQNLTFACLAVNITQTWSDFHFILQMGDQDKKEQFMKDFQKASRLGKGKIYNNILWGLCLMYFIFSNIDNISLLS